jgi:hypothetical protein
MEVGLIVVKRVEFEWIFVCGRFYCMVKILRSSF